MKWITLWRKPAPDFLDHDFHVSFHESEIDSVICNLKQQGVKQYSTYELTDKPLAEWSSEY